MEVIAAHMKKVLLGIVFICFQTLAFSQSAEDTAGIVAFGVGDNEADALHNAIVNAVNQVFGSYISTKTEIMNDSLIVDQFSSINNGNIQRYQVIKSEKTGNGHFVTIKAYVNLKNTIEFCKSIGIEAEIQGGLMADNLSMKLKNIETEQRVMETFFSIFKKEIQNIFSYTITVEDPIKASNTNDFLTKINSKVELNPNFNSILNVLIDVVEGASLPLDELADYRKFNLEFYPVFVQTKEKFCYRFLRSKESLKILAKFITSIDAAIQNHVVVRNDGKELGPVTVSGSGMNIFYYHSGSYFEKYNFFSTGSQPISVGKMAYKCTAGEESTLIELIKKAYTVPGCFELEDSKLLSNTYILNELAFMETPFFFMTSRCVEAGQPIFKFSYKDWMSLDELKTVNKYSLRF